MTASNAFATVPGARIRLVALGNSITAGLGLPARDAFPAQLQALLAAEGIDIEIENAGVSGDTVADGLARLDWSIPERTDGVILALGANDMLRGLDATESRKGMQEIVERLLARHMVVMIVGMKASLNSGEAYRNQFDAIFPDLAKQHMLDYVPFLLEPVVRKPDLNQADGIHPNAEGARLIAQMLLPATKSLLSRIGKD